MLGVFGVPIWHLYLYGAVCDMAFQKKKTNSGQILYLLIERICFSFQSLTFVAVCFMIDSEDLRRDYLKVPDCEWDWD